MKFEFPETPPPEDISKEDWLSWTWQLRNSLRTISDIKKILFLNEEEDQILSQDLDFPFRVTPYYLKLADPHNPLDPIRKMVVPLNKEKQRSGQHLVDPLGEKQNNVAPRIIHRYSDRVLFLVTDFCSVYCRYCTRKHFTGQDAALPKEPEYQAALDYIKNHSGIREVILSGGDPLTLSDKQLQRVLVDIRAIEHVEIIRIGTRMPVVCPMRVTEELVKMLRSFKPVFLMTHFNHPKELTKEAAMALESLVDHGIPVFNQMVLLNGINNHASIVQALNRRLLYLRVKPYYMFQCDPSQGTEHFRTPIEQGENIMRELWGHLSGLAMPIFSLDIPEGGGKVTLVPNFEVERSPIGRCYEGWDGKKAWYINPQQSQLPVDYEDYLKEWEILKNSKS